MALLTDRMAVGLDAALTDVAEVQFQITAGAAEQTELRTAVTLRSATVANPCIKAVNAIGTSPGASAGKTIHSFCFATSAHTPRSSAVALTADVPLLTGGMLTWAADGLAEKLTQA